MRLRPAVLDSYGAALDPAEFTQPLLKGTDPVAHCRCRGRAQKTDQRYLARLLRARRERLSGGCCRAANEPNEIPPPHSINSSASASSVGGTIRPSAFAVLRLITNSNLVGCITGKSA